jgi:hypothetical protein
MLMLSFTGPYSWLPGRLPSVFEAPAASSPGIYLWTVETTPHGELVYYVGETGRDFRSRFVEHLKEQVSGYYRLYDPAAMLQGDKRLLWRGLYGRGAEPTLAPFIENLERLAPPLRTFIGFVRFYLGPLEVDSRLRRRIEAAIADHLYGQSGPANFQDAGIRYDRRHPDEAPTEVRLDGVSTLRGLPEVVAA